MGKFKNECIAEGEDAEANPYKIYETPHGTFVFSKEEFDLVVEYFRTLNAWRDQAKTSGDPEAE